MLSFFFVIVSMHIFILFGIYLCFDVFPIYLSDFYIACVISSLLIFFYIYFLCNSISNFKSPFLKFLLPLVIFLTVIINFIPFNRAMEIKREFLLYKIDVLTSAKNIVTLEEKQLKDPLTFTNNLAEIEKNINSLEALTTNEVFKNKTTILIIYNLKEKEIRMLMEDLKEIKALTEKLLVAEENKQKNYLFLINNKIFFLKEKIDIIIKQQDEM